MEQLHDPIAELARERFGIAYLYPYQRLVVANVLDTAAAFRARPEPENGGNAAAAGKSGAEGDAGSPTAGNAAATGQSAGDANPDDEASDDSLSEAPPERHGLRQIVVLPTGAGKSLCFQLPALALPEPTLVVFPLLGLIADQKRRLEERGIPCATFQGGMERAEAARELDKIRRGEARIALTNPESLGSPPVRELMESAGVFHLVVDEAHCVSEWGDTFRPAYLRVGDFIREWDPPAVTAFTATASPTVLVRMAKLLFRGEPYGTVSGDADRPNISYAVTRTYARFRTLTRLALERPKPMIVFTSSREGAELVAERLGARLRERGERTPVRFYHAGLERAEKKALEAWFLSSKDGILAATCAYGLGMDKPDVRTVVHVDPPPSIEAYLQESGRAGRDGGASGAVLIRALPAASGERGPKSRRDDRAADARESATEFQEAMEAERAAAVLAYADRNDRCRRESLLSYLGSRFTACFGCDVCEGKADAPPEGEREIVSFVAANRRRFDAPRTTAGLLGSFDEPCARKGVLAGWDEADARAALAGLVEDGKLVTRRGVVWKGLADLPGSVRFARFGRLFRGRGRFRRGRFGLRGEPEAEAARGGGAAVGIGDGADDEPGDDEADGGDDHAPVRHDAEADPQRADRVAHCGLSLMPGKAVSLCCSAPASKGRE